MSRQDHTAENILYGQADPRRTKRLPTSPLSLSEARDLQEYLQGPKTFSADHPDRNGNYRYLYALSEVIPFESVTEFAVFEDRSDAEAMAIELNGHDHPRRSGEEGWEVQLRASFKVGTRPEKIVLYCFRWPAKSEKGEADPTVIIDENTEYEHLVSDQQLSGTILRERRLSKGAVVISTDRAEAERLMQEIIAERIPLIKEEYLRQKKLQARRCYEERERADERAEADRKRRQKRAERLKAKGLPEDHEGPTDPVANKRWREQRGKPGGDAAE